MIFVEVHLTSVSAVQSVGGFCLNRSDSVFSGLYGLNHSDSAAHANHYAIIVHLNLDKRYEKIIFLLVGVF